MQQKICIADFIVSESSDSSDPLKIFISGDNIVQEDFTSMDLLVLKGP